MIDEMILRREKIQNNLKEALNEVIETGNLIKLSTNEISIKIYVSSTDYLIGTGENDDVLIELTNQPMETSIKKPTYFQKWYEENREYKKQYEKMKREQRKFEEMRKARGIR